MYEKEWGFVAGRYNPCMFQHPLRKVLCLVHGDDFVSVGEDDQLQWLKKKLQGRFEIKTKLEPERPKHLDNILRPVAFRKLDWMRPNLLVPGKNALCGRFCGKFFRCREHQPKKMQRITLNKLGRLTGQVKRKNPFNMPQWLGQ